MLGLGCSIQGRDPFTMPGPRQLEGGPSVQKAQATSVGCVIASGALWICWAPRPSMEHRSGWA